MGPIYYFKLLSLFVCFLVLSCKKSNRTEKKDLKTIVKNVDIKNDYPKIEKTEVNNNEEKEEEVTNEKLKLIKEWVGDNIIIDSIIGDLNKDLIEDKLYFLISKNKIQEETPIEVVILNGSKQKNMFSLYHKSKKIVPCQFCRFEKYFFTTDSPFYVSDLKQNKLEINTTSYDPEEVKEDYSFTFECKKDKIVLTNIIKTSSKFDIVTKEIKLPDSEITLRNFDVYFFIKKHQSDSF